MQQPPSMLKRVISGSLNSSQSSNSVKVSSKVPLQFTSQIRQSKRKSQIVELSLIRLTSLRKINCQLCQTSVSEHEACTVGTCNHKFCKDCLTQYSIYKINVSEEVKCPEENCDCKLSVQSPIFELFPQNIKERYKHQQLWRQTINNPNIKICPQEDCKQGIVDLMLDPPKCRKCSKMFCKECMMEFHPEKPCDDNFQGHFKEWKRCPKCKMFIQKDGGCNHIVCQCNHQFCFVCMSDWENSHYECLQGMQNRLFIHEFQQIGFLPSLGLFIILIIFFPIFLVLAIIGGIICFAFFCVIGVLVSPCVSAQQMPEGCCLCWLIGLPLIMAVGGIMVPIMFTISVYIPHAHRKGVQYCNSISFLLQNILH